jgi:site-specific recombinase XerD
MHKVEELLFNFREHLKARGRSTATVDLYTDQARRFLMAAAADDIRQVTKSDIEAYIVGLYGHKTDKGAPYTTGTICTKVRAVKRLFEYLETANIIFINPCEAITEPPKDKTLPRHVLTRKEVQKLLDQPNLALMTGIRDRAILEVFYSTGIRLAELCALTVFDADLTGAMVRVNCGKGGKDRVVPLGRHAVKALREYITKARPRLTKNNRKERRLFINRYGNPSSVQVVGIMIRTFARQAKIKRKVTAHSLRHTFATALVENGADIRAVQKMLGHADLATTQQYIRALGLDIKAVHQKTHPREKDKATKESFTPQIERVKGRYERKQL